MLGTRGKIFVAVLIGAFAVSSLALADLPARADEIKTHLEMLGYTVEKTDKALRCKHDKHVNIFVRSYKGGILISGYFTGNEYSKTHRAEFLEFINTLNKEATVIRAYIDKDGDLMLEAWFVGDYDRARFGKFVDAWHTDAESLLNSHSAEATMLLK